MSSVEIAPSCIVPGSLTRTRGMGNPGACTLVMFPERPRQYAERAACHAHGLISGTHDGASQCD